jgi:hypothetical protein
MFLIQGKIRPKSSGISRPIPVFRFLRPKSVSPDCPGPGFPAKEPADPEELLIDWQERQTRNVIVFGPGLSKGVAGANNYFEIDMHTVPSTFHCLCSIFNFFIRMVQIR